MIFIMQKTIFSMNFVNKKSKKLSLNVDFTKTRKFSKLIKWKKTGML